MGKLKKNQTGFSAVEALLIIIVLGIIGFTGWYVLHAKQNANKNLTVSSASTPISKKQTSPSSTPSSQMQPTDFVKSLLSVLANGNEASLAPDLTQSFTAFRAANLAAAPCKGKSITNPMVLFCGSLLNPSTITSLTPTVSDYTFKNGQKGKSVTYQQAQTTGDKGVTYYTFKLVSVKTSWQLNDYNDLFVGAGSTVPSPLLGLEESSN